MADTECKRCLLYEMADKAAFASVKNYTDSLPEDEKVPENIYRDRLDICRACDCLLSAMCRKCGCYVEVRAILRNSECPMLTWHKYLE